MWNIFASEYIFKTDVLTVYEVKQFCQLQKKPLESVLRKRCSNKLCKVYKKHLCRVPFFNRKSGGLNSWFLLAKCLKTPVENGILSKDSGHWPASLIKMSLSTGVFQTFC